MKSFVILTRRADGAEEDLKRLAKPEVVHVWRGFADGIVSAVHGMADRPCAALDLESGIFEGARHCIEALRCVKRNLLHVKHCALKPFSGYEGLQSS
jgi:hypothetical protein